MGLAVSFDFCFWIECSVSPWSCCCNSEAVNYIINLLWFLIFMCCVVCSFIKSWILSSFDGYFVEIFYFSGQHWRVSWARFGLSLINKQGKLMFEIWMSLYGRVLKFFMCVCHVLYNVCLSNWMFSWFLFSNWMLYFTVMLLL